MRLTYRHKLYTKHQDIINAYLRLKVEFNLFKLDYKRLKYSSVFTQNTRLKTQKQIEELETKLTKKGLNTQKLRKIYTKIINKKPFNNFEQIIVNNFIQNGKKAPQLFKHERKFDNRFTGLLLERKKRRVKAAKEVCARRPLASEKQKAQQLVPYIFQFIKLRTMEKYGYDEKFAVEVTGRIFSPGCEEALDMYLREFRDLYGNTDQALSYFKKVEAAPEISNELLTN